mmetsp:Transcript_23737/g.64583  ORF Transcript_23737/g.64583 Transcript_23737/m.64583 type:complete len:232 (-) Transcript_23737:77-772(-)
MSASPALGAPGGRIIVAPGTGPRHILAAFPPWEEADCSATMPTAALTATATAARPPQQAPSRGRRGQRRPQQCLLGSVPPACRSSRATLFSGERVCTNPRAKRASAVVFRRPCSSKTAPHTRPIFVTGENGTDPRICVDVHAPGRFSSCEQARYESIRGNRGDLSHRAGSALGDLSHRAGTARGDLPPRAGSARPASRQARARTPSTPGSSRPTSVLGNTLVFDSQVAHHS